MTSKLLVITFCSLAEQLGHESWWWAPRHDEWVGVKLRQGKIGNLQSEIGSIFGAPAGIRTPNQQIMRRFEGHQQGETKRDNPVFTESAAVKVR